jgi:hypothetical protein
MRRPRRPTQGQGYVLVCSGWQPEANHATATYKAYYPLARDGPRPIVRKVLEVYIPDTPEAGTGGANAQTLTGSTLTSNLTYPPAARGVEDAHVSLTVRENHDDGRVPLSPSAVTFLGGTRVRIDLAPVWLPEDSLSDPKTAG